MKQTPLDDATFQSSPKRFQSNISRPNNDRNFYTSNYLHFLIIYSFLTSLFPNWVNRAQSCMSCVESDGKIEISILWNISLSQEFLLTPVLTSLTQNWVKKKSGLVFHVQIVIERWKSTAKENLRRGFHFWKHSLRILKFWLPPLLPPAPPWLGHQPKNVSKKYKLVFHIPILTERWKSKPKDTLS